MHLKRSNKVIYPSIRPLALAPQCPIPRAPASDPFPWPWPPTLPGRPRPDPPPKPRACGSSPPKWGHQHRAPAPPEFVKPATYLLPHGHLAAQDVSDILLRLRGSHVQHAPSQHRLVHVVDGGGSILRVLELDVAEAAVLGAGGVAVSVAAAAVAVAVAALVLVAGGKVDLDDLAKGDEGLVQDRFRDRVVKSTCACARAG